MANSTTFHTTSITIADDQGSPPTEIRLANAPGFPGWCEVQLLRGGEVAARPIVFQMTNSGGRVAAEFPSCDPAVCVVDENGSITNG